MRDVIKLVWMQKRFIMMFPGFEGMKYNENQGRQGHFRGAKKTEESPYRSVYNCEKHR